MEKIKEYFKGVKKEFLRIRWPERKDLIKYSTATIVFVILCAIFFLGIDALNAYIRQLYEGIKK